MTTATLANDIRHAETITKKCIVFEDDDIRVIFKPGSSSYLLITFGDLKNLAEEDLFYAEKPATKLNISCLGVMAKTPNWFPAKSMAYAKAKLNTLLSKFSEFTTYGGSMGGYAAIKYSSLFNSSTTLAFCPQWSIDPTECGDSRSGYEKYFTPCMSNMGIKPENITGQLFILYDPAHRIDTFHAEKILDQSPTASMIPVHYSNHHVTTILAGTSQLGEFIDLARNRHFKRLKKVVCKQRKHSPIRTKIIYTRALSKHPKIVANLLEHSEKTKLLRPKEILDIDQKLLPLLIELNLLELATSSIKRLARASKCPTQKQLLEQINSSILLKIARKKSYDHPIHTCHNTILSYNLMSGELIHTSINEAGHTAKLLAPVNIHQDKLKSFFFITINMEKLYINLHKTHTTLTDQKDLATQINIIKNPDKSVSFLLADRYLCAERNGLTSINRKKIDKWETFKTSSPATASL